MFVRTFNGIYIGLSVVIDTGLSADAHFGTFVGTDMTTSVGVTVSVSLINPLQYDCGTGPKEFFFFL